jgi:hypothetical protein
VRRCVHIRLDVDTNTLNTSIATRSMRPEPDAYDNAVFLNVEESAISAPSPALYFV